MTPGYLATRKLLPDRLSATHFKLIESGSIPIKPYLSSTPVACANNLQREPIWIDNVETFPGATRS